MSKIPAENKKQTKTKPIQIEFDDNSFLSELCGRHDSNLVQIEERLGVQLVPKGNKIAIFGNIDQGGKAKAVLEDLYELLKTGMQVSAPQVDAALRFSDGLINARLRPADLMSEGSMITTPEKKITPHSVQQHVYVAALKSTPLVLGVGPAGTGKTYLATAVAISMLMAKKVKRIVLTRPVVEAGENLGFLPGTLEEKIDPYLRPFFDAMHEMLGAEKTKQLMEKNTIEIAPLAYMRGRSINDAFLILDEAQNTTPVQMKMFLTRLGSNARAVVTGDISQVDLKKGQRSGLRDAINVLEGIRDVDVIRFNEADVVRSNLVARIVQAYDERDRQIDLKLDDEEW